MTFKVGDIVWAKAEHDSCWNDPLLCLLTMEFETFNDGTWSGAHICMDMLTSWSVIPERHADPDAPEAVELRKAFALARLEGQL